MSYQDVLSKFDELILASKDGFSSREYLDAVLNATGSKDMASALENLQNQMSGSYDDLKEYLKSANTNRETISKYTATWEEIKKTLEEQLATLKSWPKRNRKRRPIPGHQRVAAVAVKATLHRKVPTGILPTVKPLARQRKSRREKNKRNLFRPIKAALRTD